MTTEQRLRLALQMNEAIRNVALAGLRSRRPDLPADQLLPELNAHHVRVRAPTVTLENLLSRLTFALERALEKVE